MNAYRHPALNIAWKICAVALFCTTQDVFAQTIYRQVNADGRITFTDHPDLTLSTRRTAAPALDVVIALAGSSAMSSQRAAKIDAREASRRLAQAQLERKQGAAPLPHEQAQGTEASALNKRYWRRQEKLQHVVDQAQLRSDETRRAHRATLARNPD